mgnify:CR=1 FL=1
MYISKTKFIISSTRLKEHRWIHTDHKPHRCDLCEQAFRHSNHLKHHQAKIHGKKKDFECHLCNKTFCYAYELRNHIKSSHENKKRANNQGSYITNFHSNQGLQQLDNELTKYEFECQLCQKLSKGAKTWQKKCSYFPDKVFLKFVMYLKCSILQQIHVHRCEPFEMWKPLRMTP